MIGTYGLPDFNVDDAATYKATIDANAKAAERLASMFACHEQTVPNMTVRVDAGVIWHGNTLSEIAAQSTGTITAPVSQSRIDRVVLDQSSGDVSVVTGTPSGSPVAPAIIVGMLPLCQVLLDSSSTVITNTMITDERVPPTQRDFNLRGQEVPDLIVNLYDPTDQDGRAAFCFRSNHEDGIPGLETHTVFIETTGHSSALKEVVDSTYGLGISNLKKDWQTTTVKGQSHGLSIVTRGGYNGTFENLSGDTAGIVINSATSSGSFCAVLEGVSSYFPSGVLSAQVRCQVGIVNQGFNNYMGYYASAETGGLGPAFYAAGQSTTATWTDAFRYDANLGAGFQTLYRVNQAGWIVLHALTGAAPKKTLRSFNSNFEIVNSADSTVIFSVADSGSVDIAAGAIYRIGGVGVVAPRDTGWSSWTGASSKASKATSTATVEDCAQAIKQLIDTLTYHGLIGS